MITRSLLFVPGHMDNFFEKAGKSEADILLLDTEDSVPTPELKAQARVKIRKAINHEKFKGKILIPRINSSESGELLKDLEALICYWIHGFMISKIETADDIKFYDQLLSNFEKEKLIQKGKFKLLPLIETAKAVANVKEISMASDRIIGIAFGNEDFQLDSNINYLNEVKASIALAAKAAGIFAINTVHIDISDTYGLERSLIDAKGWGYEGSLLIHPDQIALANRIFSPTVFEVRDAKQLVEDYEEALSEGKAVSRKGGKFIGPPLAKKAKQLIERYEKISNIRR